MMRTQGGLPVLVPGPLPQASLRPKSDSLHHRAVPFQRQHPLLEVIVAAIAPENK